MSNFPISLLLLAPAAMAALAFSLLLTIAAIGRCVARLARPAIDRQRRQLAR